jgi:hypothetical protein
MEYLLGIGISILTYFLGARTRNLTNKKLELEILNIGTDVWGSIKEDLMEQIKNLKNEVNDLKNENIQLRAEIVKLQSVIATHNNSN